MSGISTIVNVVIISGTKTATDGISYVTSLGGEVTNMPAQFTGAGARVMRVKLCDDW